MMSRTVVGIFEYESDAQNAQNYLLANGFGDGSVDIKTARYKSETSDDSSGDADLDLLEKIRNFFQELFTDDQHEAERYTEAGRQGTIVTVHANSADEAVAAAHIMDEYGAMDVKNGNRDQQAGQQYEDPIVNPPSSSGEAPVVADSVDARGPYFRSRVIDRPLQHQFRLSQHPSASEHPVAHSTQEAPELHNTIAGRDALIKEITENDPLKP